MANDCDDEKKEAPGKTVMVAYNYLKNYFSSINKIGILFAFLRVRAYSKYTILALQVDFNIFWQNTWK